NWRMFEAKALLGGALLGQKKYADAEPLLLAGYRGMSARAVRMPPAAEGPDRPDAALDWLIGLADARADNGTGARWRQQRAAGRRERGRAARCWGSPAPPPGRAPPPPSGAPPADRPLLPPPGRRGPSGQRLIPVVGAVAGGGAGTPPTQLARGVPAAR